MAPPVIFGASPESPFQFPRANDELVKHAMIMIIVDDDSTTGSIRQPLEKAGFTNFTHVKNADRAVEAIHQSKPDVVLLDTAVIDSEVRILKEIRKTESTSSLPILSLNCSDDEITRTTLLNLGANDFLKKPVRASELVARVRNVLSSKVAFDQLAIQSAKLQVDVLQDSLTKLANRRAFDFELNRKMIEWERQRTPVSLLLIDIDHFKMVNDRFGHPAGDSVLNNVAEIIRQSTRKMDLPCRIGGEEFAVILPVTRSCESNQAGERIRSQVESSIIRTDVAAIRLTVSIGIANAMKGDDASLLVRRADTALYAGKQRGRNCSTLHDGTKCVAIEGAQCVAFEEQRIERKVAVDFNINASSVMIVDDEPADVAEMEKCLAQGGFERLTTELEPTLASERILAELPDLVLLRQEMKELDGLSILKVLRQHEQAMRIPVILLTESQDSSTQVEALKLGANDFLGKPVNSGELLARVRNTLMAKAHVELLTGYSAKLEHEVQVRTKDLVTSRREAIQCLARAAEMRDDETGQHVIRVGRYAAIIAKELGFTREQIVDLEHAAQLHDVGKIGVPDAILNKPDRLTPEEFEAIKNHCHAGSRIIRDDARISEESESSAASTPIGDFLDECNSPVMRLAALVAETHHEKWDGTGYPRGLSGEDIPIEGRITAVCDVFDAVSTSRPYKKAYSLEKCFEIIAEGRDKHFDPVIVDAFFRRQEEIVEAYYEHSNQPRVVKVSE